MKTPSVAPWGRMSRALMLCVVALASLALVACGSDDEPEAGGTTGGSAAAGGADDLKAFEAKIDSDLAEAAERSSTVPTDGPQAAPGKKVYVIACILAAEGCARESRTAVEAAKAIGWEVKLIDTGSVPAKMASAIQQAIDAKADGLIIQAIDAKFIAGPLGKAKDAGLKVVCFACVNQDGLVDHQIPTEEDFVADGYTLGQQMYKSTGGKPRLVFMFDASFGVTDGRKKGTEQFFEDCKAAGGDCEILGTENFLVTELTTRVPGLASQVARKHKDVNAIWMSYDSAGPAITQGLRTARVDPEEVGLYGFDGNTHNIDAIRDGNYQVATMAGPFEQIGWDEVDALNRMFQDQEPQRTIKTRLLTADNLPEGNTFSGEEGFEDAYKQVWGK